MQWYLAKVKYFRLVKGKLKSFTEQYMFYCINYGDVEATATEMLKSRIKNPDVDDISKVRVQRENVFKQSETLMTDVEGVFFQVNAEYDMGEGKKETETYIVNAKNPETAIDRIHKRLKDVLFDYKIKGVKELLVDAIYDKANIVWVQDFESRMEDMEFDGKVEAHINQTTIPLGKDVNKEAEGSEDGVSKARSIIDDMVDTLGKDGVTVSVKSGKDGEYKTLGGNPLQTTPTIQPVDGDTDPLAAAAALHGPPPASKPGKPLTKAQQQKQADKQKLAQTLAETMGASEVTISGQDETGETKEFAHYQVPPTTKEPLTPIDQKLSAEAKKEEEFVKEPIANKFARIEGRGTPLENPDQTYGAV